MARLRSRIIFLKEGDANTKLFHLQSSNRTNKKFIAQFHTDEGVAVTQQEKEEVLFQHFTKILGTPHQRSEAINFLALGIQQADLTHLEAPFFRG